MAKNVNSASVKKVKELKKEVSRKASMANKRLRRLEKNDLTDNFAYKSVVKNGKPQFSVKGKDYNELQKELTRINHFIDAKTSTIRGTNQVLKEIANNTNVTYENVNELYKKSKQFFQLSEKVSEYLSLTNQSGLSLGYQRIWQAINEYVEKEQADLASSEFEMEKAVKSISHLAGALYVKDAFDYEFNMFDELKNDLK